MQLENNTFTKLNARVATSIVLAAVVGLLLLFSLVCIGKWLAMFVVLGLVMICAHEFSTFAAGPSKPARRALYFLLPVLPSVYVLYTFFQWGVCGSGLHMQLYFDLGAFSLVGQAFLLSALFALGHVFFVGRISLDQSIDVAREIFVALVLIGLGGGMLIGLFALPSSTYILIWLILVVCLNDIAAYFIGSKLAGIKLAPAISPSKTINGSIAGLTAGALVGIIGRGLLPGSSSIVWSLVAAICVVIAAQLGDLAKSYLKRLHGVKDSGDLLPGHGGMLDRIDGVLCAAPIMAFFV